MNLSFSTQINSVPTYFPEKIMKGLTMSYPDKFANPKCWYPSGSPYWEPNISVIESCKPKVHTVRLDTHNRWKAGNIIHFTIFPRSSRMYNFIGVNNIIRCTNIQFVKIINHKYQKKQILITDEINGTKDYCSLCLDENDLLIETFAINDGFLGISEFFDWFKGTTEGKIIHWTNLKY